MIIAMPAKRDPTPPPTPPPTPLPGGDALDELSVAVLLTDRDGVVTRLNAAAEDLLGSVEVAGRPLSAVFRDLAHAGVLLPAGGLAGLPDGPVAADAPLGRIGERELVARARPRRAAAGWVVELVERGEDGDADAPDGLTGLPTRIALERRLAAALTAATERGAEAALLLIDLDRFKSVNDTLGHPVGDALLRAVAGRLRGALRKGDLPARLGGDEFAVLVTGADAATLGEALATRLVDLLGRAYLVDGHMLNIGASVGLALLPQDAADAAEAMRHADLALYGAKAAGRGTFRFFEPAMNARVQARRTLEADLRRALILREFDIAYQPLIEARTSAVAGFEALLRWSHPVRGSVPPSDFIPLAEEIGLIGPIGEWVLHTACREATRWPAAVSVAVNLSPVQFRDAGLLATVRAALDASGLAPSRLDLEITEGALLDNTDDVLRVLRDLRAIGVRIAMDDFGTGYSSLSYLQKFPFDKIKIDRSFIRDMGDDPDSAAIVRAVTGLGQSLGMRTTAEGVETKEQVARLSAEGCGELQGYLFSRPLSAADAFAYLAERAGP